ncbi:SLC13 family permease [Thermodesulfovibrio yellowstonii]|uniref:Arsenical pump membrane protein n=1 Tax=Thermodesulfovibrio yellowstonii (strain ATCC 51303 / DSM 11347 / YP87) TaxID=289376 RepID=B5YK08_THEYD|nr:ArsB/NhaD family transporter [Thermodesulfovibrio yellowstonii]ACI21771.1 arsenical pump membrane protein [Thermodesulfovibrio yellowstonii DSM 11347]
MKKLLLMSFFLLLIFNFSAFASEAEKSKENVDIFYISGSILDSHKEPVRDAEISLLVNGKPHKLITDHKETDKTLTSSHGTFQMNFHLPQGGIDKAKIEIEIVKSSYKRTTIEFKKENFAQKGNEFYLSKDIIVQRHLGPAFWIATAVFLLAYALISFELLHRTVAAMIGAATMLILTYTLGTFNPEFHIISFERAIQAIDMNVIFLLMGMMIIIGVLKHTGVFQWCAYMSYKIARGNIMILAVISCFFIAFTSAFLDNVTTMLLYTPVLIEIAIALKINPLSLLIPGIMASNVGGTATLIGDPPNIMIGSYTGLTFMQFVYALTPVCIIVMLVLVFYNKFFYSKEYKKGKVDDINAFISYLREEYKITDKTLLGYGLFIMALVVSFFATHGFWHMEVSIPALFGAGVLFTYAVLTKKVKMLELIEKDIEWPTLLFFIFLFIIVGAVEEAGLLAVIADWVHNLSAGNLTVAICLILWVSAIMSAFVDNIPFTATMLPIVAYLTKVIPGAESNVLWWALALGACLGGNGTLIGASANVVTIGIAESAGHKISFFGFMKYAFLYMIISVAICNVWLLLFY